MAILKWCQDTRVDWHYIPPAEAEANFYAALEQSAMAA
jgi:hypothetical protein